MGLGCLDIFERGCERLAAMCVMARRGVLERALEEHETTLQIVFGEKKKKPLFHAWMFPTGLSDRHDFSKRHEKVAIANRYLVWILQLL